MKRLLLTIALACALASSAFAGEIPSVGAPAPPPAGTQTNTPSAGDVPRATEQVSDVVLSALLTVLGLLSV